MLLEVLLFFNWVFSDRFVMPYSVFIPFLAACYERVEDLGLLLFFDNGHLVTAGVFI